MGDYPFFCSFCSPISTFFFCREVYDCSLIIDFVYRIFFRGYMSEYVPLDSLGMDTRMILFCRLLSDISLVRVCTYRPWGSIFSPSVWSAVIFEKWMREVFFTDTIYWSSCTLVLRWAYSYFIWNLLALSLKNPSDQEGFFYSSNILLYIASLRHS